MQDLPEGFRLIERVLPMLGAFVLALPIALDRERNARGPGLRTFPLVAMATCGFVLLSQQIVSDPTAVGRILAGLMTGIGFIGGGAILKKGSGVAGLASATSIWITGAIGASMALAAYDVAVSLSLLTLAVLRLSRPVKEVVSESKSETGD